jgi:uncharacterized membrane protein YhaH (DUF805 family)
MDSFIDVWKKGLNFTDRATRKEFWMFTVIHYIIIILLSFVGGMLGGDSVLGSVPVGIYLVAGFVPTIAVSVRRMHDTGRSGWWVLISLVPLIGGIWYLVLTVLDSKPESNQWGPSPKYAGQDVI